MPTGSLAAQINKARLMTEGIKANLTRLQRRGVTADHAGRGADLAARVERLDQEQEALKSQLQAKTATLKATQAELYDWYTESRALVRLEFGKDPAALNQFGL
jgi:hypothetical protein